MSQLRLHEYARRVDVRMVQKTAACRPGTAAVSGKRGGSLTNADGAGRGRTTFVRRAILCPDRRNLRNCRELDLFNSLGTRNAFQIHCSSGVDLAARRCRRLLLLPKNSVGKIRVKGNERGSTWRHHHRDRERDSCFPCYRHYYRCCARGADRSFHCWSDCILLNTTFALGTVHLQWRRSGLTYYF